MNIDTFNIHLLEEITPGAIFQNPGGGTSVIISVKNGNIRYKRGESTMAISINMLFDAYAAFRGKIVSTSDLKTFSPAVFDSEARPAGHNCHGTFLFLVLLKMGIVTRIDGTGVRGDPFFVAIPKE